MNTFAALPLFVAILNFLLVIFILRQGTKKKLNRAFAALSFFVMVWNCGYFLMYVSPTKEFAFFFGRQIIFFGVVFLPPTLLYFIMVIIDNFTRPTRISCLVFYTLSLILFLLNFNGFITNDVIRYAWGYLPKASQTGFIFILLFISCNVYALTLLFQAMRKSWGIKHNQLKYIFWGATLCYAGGVTNFLTVHLGKKIAMYPIGNGIVLLWLGIIAYTIYKHHLMDIDIVIRKSAVYAYLSFIVLIPCAIIIIFAQKNFFGQINPFFSFLMFSSLFLVILIIFKFKPDIEEYIEKSFFKGKFQSKIAIKELSKIIISFLDEDEMIKKAEDILTRDLGAERISFFLLDREKRSFVMRGLQKKDVNKVVSEVSHNDPFFKWLKKNSKTVVKEELELSGQRKNIKHLLRRLDSLKSEVCIPLMARENLIGIINLGKRRGGKMYSHEDLELLTNFANQASIALENARLYREMQRTQLLMRRTDRMASLGSLTAGLAHEIRNPLVTIKTFLELLPERYEDQEFRTHFLKLTASEVDRINNLVSELLSFARPSKPKFEKADVNKVIKEIIRLITPKASKNEIVIDVSRLENHFAMFDAEQMKQVFLNILLNAIDAVSAHGKISVSSRRIKKNGVEYIQVEISDTGLGIAQNIAEQIFDPFFTTKEKGIGLGLSISHQIVQEHNGFINVESQLQKGSTFIINIPA